MPLPIQSVRQNEQSANVAALHAALSSLGLQVDPREVSEQRAGDSTAKAVRQIQTQLNLAPAPGYVVDEATARAINQLLQAREAMGGGGEVSYLAFGAVTLPGAQPARAVALKLFDQDLRKRQTLGQTTTDTNGKYKISYNAKQFQSAELGGPDLVLEAYGPGGEVLKSSDVYYNAPPFAQLDLALDRTGSEAEYDRIVRIVTPLLAGQDVTLDALEENDKIHDLAFLGGETGIARDELASFAI